MQVTLLNKRVVKEMNSLRASSKASFARTVELMQKYGTHAIGLPHVRKLNKELWEIRMKDADGIARAIFTVKNNEIIILHSFTKKTQKTPKQSINLALQRIKEIGE